MRARLSYAWHRLRASLWFVPSLMLTAAVVLSFATIWLDARISIRALTDPGGEFFIGPGGSRELLSTIAASMISVASLVFSITLVVLQLASSQLGPRLMAGSCRTRSTRSSWARSSRPSSTRSWSCAP